MSYPIYLVPTTEINAILAAEETRRTLTEGMFVAGGKILRIDGTDCYVHGTSESPRTWTPIAEANDAETWAQVPAEHRVKLTQATVYRRRDGRSLRRALEIEVETTLPTRVPVTGRSSAQPPDKDGAERALQRALQMAIQNGTVEAEKLRLPMDQVQSGDLVEEDVLPPHVWMT